MMNAGKGESCRELFKHSFPSISIRTFTIPLCSEKFKYV